MLVIVAVVCALGGTAIGASAQAGGTLAQPASSENGKPPRLHAETSCAPCRDLARQLNDAYGGLDFLWDRRLSLERSIRVTGQAIAERAAEIARLEQAVPPSGRTRQQQDAIDALKRVNAQQQDSVDRHRRELDGITRQIDEQNKRITDLRGRLTECEKQCAPPSTPDPPVADPPTPTAAGEPSFTLAKVPCPACQRLANRILALQEDRAELVEELQYLETAAEAQLGGFLKAPKELPLRTGGDGDAIRNSIESVLDDLDLVEAEIAATWAALTLCLLNCSVLPEPIYTKAYFYGPAIGAGVVGGFLLKGDSPTSSTSAEPPPVQNPPPVQQQPPPPPPPPNPQTSCRSVEGSYVFTGMIRMPRGCFITGSAPVFASPINGTMTVQLDDSCSGTVTTRYPNSWAFAYRVSATVSGSSVQLRSTTPFVNTQPFGVPFNSTIDLTVTGTTASGIETHMSGSCTDSYSLQGSRQ